MIELNIRTWFTLKRCCSGVPKLQVHSCICDHALFSSTKTHFQTFFSIVANKVSKKPCKEKIPFFKTGHPFGRNNKRKCVFERDYDTEKIFNSFQDVVHRGQANLVFGFRLSLVYLDYLSI